MKDELKTRIDKTTELRESGTYGTTEDILNHIKDIWNLHKIEDKESLEAAKKKRLEKELTQFKRDLRKSSYSKELKQLILDNLKK